VELEHSNTTAVQRSVKTATAAGALFRSYLNFTSLLRGVSAAAKLLLVLYFGHGCNSYDREHKQQF
jgi:hypothetical protein